MEDHCKRTGRLARWLAVLALALGAFPGAAGAACPDLPHEHGASPRGATPATTSSPPAATSRARARRGPAAASWAATTRSTSPAAATASRSGSRQGATATSPTFCADVRHPDFRFVARPLNPCEPGLAQRVRALPRPWGGTQTWQMWTFAGIQYWTASPRVRLMRDLPLPELGRDDGAGAVPRGRRRLGRRRRLHRSVPQVIRRQEPAALAPGPAPIAEPDHAEQLLEDSWSRRGRRLRGAELRAELVATLAFCARGARPLVRVGRGGRRGLGRVRHRRRLRDRVARRVPRRRRLRRPDAAVPAAAARRRGARDRPAARVRSASRSARSAPGRPTAAGPTGWSPAAATRGTPSARRSSSSPPARPRPARRRGGCSSSRSPRSSRWRSPRRRCASGSRTGSPPRCSCA